ncbi:unnamed protein product [Rhizophagus irregularis]|nr:unnamed protein product [Rhizophagus irregularis]
MASFIAFYHVYKIEDWTCNNLVDYYRDKMKQKDWKKVLDGIKKDLLKVTSSDSEFDTIRREKAQEILDSWKDWTSTYDSFRNNGIRVNMRVGTINQLNLTGDSSTQNISTTSRKRRDREETERDYSIKKESAF